MERLGDAVEKKEVPDDIKVLRKGDIVFGAILLITVIFYLAGALKMPISEITGSPDKWFTAPGVFPIMIGIGLLISIVVLFIQVLPEAGGINREDIRRARTYLKTPQFKRLAIATGLLTIYIFVLLGNIRYEISTFIYLFTNMLVFKFEKGFHWKVILKIFVVSAITAFVVGYGFSKFALIPLP